MCPDTLNSETTNKAHGNCFKSVHVYTCFDPIHFGNTCILYSMTMKEIYVLSRNDFDKLAPSLPSDYCNTSSLPSRQGPTTLYNYWLASPHN